MATRATRPSAPSLGARRRSLAEADPALLRPLARAGARAATAAPTVGVETLGHGPCGLHAPHGGLLLLVEGFAA
jgi:hypothetical protein